MEIINKKYGKDPDPSKMSPMDELHFRHDYTDAVADRAVDGVRRRQSRSRWTFGMPNVSQERWDEIFGKKK